MSESDMVVDEGGSSNAPAKVFPKCRGTPSASKRMIEQLEQVDPNFVLTPEDFEIACRVIAYLGKNNDVYESPTCRPLRRLMQPLFNAQKGKMFQGTNAADNAEKQQRKRMRAQELNKQRLEDKEFLKRTILRASRIKKLEDLVQDQPGVSLPMILDGVADDNVHMYNHKHTALLTSSAADSTAQKQIEGSGTNDDDNAAGNVDAEREDDTDSANINMNNDTSEAKKGESLNTSRGCYICKRRFKVLHHFYDTLCESCATLNWSKRMQFCDMTGRVCLVTGGRVKIGFQSCLKLLRAGAVVIATSRFPADTSLRYAAQHDFDVWRDRLHVFGVDLRDLGAIEELCAYLQKNFPWIDAVINNACQTIRRPPVYYADVMETERKVEAEYRRSQGGEASSSPYLHILQKNWEYRAQCRDSLMTPALTSSSSTRAIEGGTAVPSTSMNTEDTTAVSSLLQGMSSAEKSQIAMVPEDASFDRQQFPEGYRDINQQQIDLRRSNSWLITLPDVSTPELAEVFAINSMAPFILCSKLKPMFLAKRPPVGTFQSSGFILNPDSADMQAGFASTSNVSLAASVLESLMNKSYASGVKLLGDSSSSALATSDGTSAPVSEADAKKQKHAWKGGGNISGHFGETKGTETGESSSSNNDNNAGGKQKSKNEVDPDPVRASDCRFIVNVSSMEGKFYRRKLATHPHTNMAKAALNMLTRTSASEYQKYNIFMTAVDTGWINDENPIERAARTAETHNFATPLDEIDAAARILDPIFAPLLKAQSLRDSASDGSGEHVHVSALNDGFCAPPFGCFLKDYFPTEW